MFKANENYLKLPGSYLFSTVGRSRESTALRIQTRRLSDSASGM